MYSIKILRSSDFDRLPYSRVREAFGVTSPDKSTIYVRNTNVHDFNKMLVSHELDHLTEEVPTDVGPDGERYFLGALLSGLGSLFTKALPAIGGGIANLGRSAVSGIGNVASRVGSGVGSLASNAGRGVMNLFGGGGSTPSNLTSFMSAPQKALSSFRGSQPPSPTSGGFNPLSMFGFGGGGGGDKDNNFNSKLLGGTLIGAGLMKRLPKAPQVPSGINQLTSQIQQGGTELGQLGKEKLTGQLNREFQPLSESEIQAALRGLEMEKTQNLDRIKDLYRNLRPGSDPSTDSSYRRDIQELEDQFARAKSDVLATRTRDLQQTYDAQQAQNIQMAIGASDRDIEQLKNMNDYEVERLAQQLQLDVAGTQQLKNTLISLGNTLISPETALLDRLFPNMASGI